jgi:hypothetical protein
MNQREKLYEQMENDYYNLSKLSRNKLLLFLSTRIVDKKMQFKYISEFLNMVNQIILFYFCVINLNKQFYDKILFTFLDASFIINALLYYFIIRNKKLKKESSALYFYCLIGILISKFIYSEKEFESISTFNSIINSIFIGKYNLNCSLKHHFFNFK